MADRVSNVRKKELEQPDPFLESMYMVVDTAKKMKKQLIWGGSIVAAIVCIVSITVYTIHSAETKASSMLSDALKTYAGHKESVEGYDAVNSQFTTLLNDYSNTSSGRIGRVRFADICYNAGKYDQAYKLYLAALDDFGSDTVIKNLVLSSLGHTCEALNKTEEAEKYFRDIAQGKAALLKDDALFNLGLVAMAKGDEKGGLDSFKKLSSEFSDSMYKLAADDIIARY